MMTRMTDDELLGAIMRRILTTDRDSYSGAFACVEDWGVCLDGWVDLSPDEVDVVRRIMDAHDASPVATA